MPSNTEMTTSFINNFWSTDKTGMNKLLNYIKTTHDDLGSVQNIYTERSQIEKEYGQKLLSLSEKYDMNGAESYQAILIELNKTAKSRIEFSEKLNSQVTVDLEQKLDEYKVLMEKWTLTLEEIFNEKEMRILELLKIRARYLKEYEVSKGQSTSMSETLKSQYKVLVADVDEIAQEWNTTWQEACEVMEAMEEDRIEFIKGNVWEYANLASSTLLVQDQWCENIREKLEKCSAEEEIEKCVSLYATGSQMPSTNEYVNEVRNEQKRKATTKSHEAPKPPSKPQRRQPSYQPPVEKPTLQRQSSTSSDNYSVKSNEQPPPLKRDDSYSKEEQTKSNSRASSINFRNSVDSKQLNHIKNNISSNGGSTAARAPVRRKPLDKALMEQVSNEMAMARKQRDTERQASINYNTIKNEPKKQTFDDTKPPETCRQPSEYKPDSGSISVRQGNTSHVLKETTPHSELHHDQLTHPIAPPKSPRPSPQQITNDNYDYTGQQPYHPPPQMQQQQPYHQPPQMQQQQQQQQQQYSPSPMIQPQRMQPQKSPMMQPQRSPMMQPQVSPMMQPQRSPMMQPQRSPMMHPQASPMIPPPSPMMAPSPMMQPLHSPAMNSAYLPPQYQKPPPISIPPHNYIASPLPSPNMAHANFQPTHYSDGRPILFWVRSKYDYEASDNEELSFRAHAAIGIIDGDCTQEAWWTGAVFDEYHQTWSNIGSVPSNFTEPYY